MAKNPMNPQLHNIETRSELIFRYTQKMLHSTRCTWESFSVRVVEHYHASVPPEAREIQFKTEGDPFDCARANSQKIRRFADDRISARLPVDVEESWVNALSDPYRSGCIRDLARRYGLLAVQAPGAGAVSDIQALSVLSREFGQALEGLAPLLEDGHIGPEDALLARRAERELEDLIAAATGVLERVRNLGKVQGDAASGR